MRGCNRTYSTVKVATSEAHAVIICQIGESFLERNERKSCSRMVESSPEQSEQQKAEHYKQSAAFTKPAYNPTQP